MKLWETRLLGDVVDHRLGKMLDEQKNKGEYLPYLGNINVRWGSFELENLSEMRFEFHELERYGLKYGDIVMCEGGEPGRCAIWKDEKPGMMIQKALHRIRPHSCLDNRFLYYTFLHLGRTGGFASLFTGATIQHLPGQNLAKVKIKIPPLPTQHRIAAILSAYDDLIESNRRRIALLEQAARLLYREWFVHLRFPGHEHVRVVDGAPEGWERKRIDEVAETVGGGTPSTVVSDYWDGDITWVVPSDVTKNDGIVLLDSERKITEKGLRESSARLVPANTILMTSRASVGFFALMDREVCTNQGFINVLPSKDVLRMYLLFNLMHRVEEIRGNAKGSTYPEINKSTFRAMSVLVPTEAICREFGAVVETMIRQIKNIKKQVVKLAKARDLLLARLMNGEIAV